MDDIKDIVNRVISKISPHGPYPQNHSSVSLEKIFNEKFLHHVKIFGLKDNQLVVHVDSPVYLYQLHLQKKELLEQVQKDNPEVKKILFRIGKVK